MRARMQLAHDLIRAIGHARRRVGWIAAAATIVVLGGRLGFDVAKGCDVRHAAHGAVPDLRVICRHHAGVQLRKLKSPLKTICVRSVSLFARSSRELNAKLLP